MNSCCQGCVSGDQVSYNHIDRSCSRSSPHPGPPPTLITPHHTDTATATSPSQPHSAAVRLWEASEDNRTTTTGWLEHKYKNINILRLTGKQSPRPPAVVVLCLSSTRHSTRCNVACCTLWHCIVRSDGVILTQAVWSLVPITGYRQQISTSVLTMGCSKPWVDQSNCWAVNSP